MKFIRYLPLVFTGLLLFSWMSGFAQNAVRTGTPFIQNYHPREYAEVSVSPQNWAVIRDDRGLLYVGNTEGLLEFDGVNWRIIKTTNNSIVRSLAADTAGRIYVGASGDFGYLTTDSTGTRQYKSLLPKIPEGKRTFNDIWHLARTEEGMCFVTRRKVFLYNHDTVSVINTDMALRAFEANNSTLFWTEEGLYRLADKQITLVPGTQDYAFEFAMDYAGAKILALTANGEWLAITPRKDAGGISAASATTGGSIIEPLDLPLENTMQNTVPYTGLKINNNLFAIGSYQNGIFIFNRAGQLRHLISEQYGLESNAVYSLHHDSSHRLWATLSNGFANIDLESPITRFNKAYGIQGTPTAIIKHQQGIYVGGSQGIYANIPGDNGNQFTHLEGMNSTVWEFGKANERLFTFTSGGMFEITPQNTLEEINTMRIASHEFSSRFLNVVYLGLWEGFAALELNYPEDPGDPVTVADTLEFPEITSSIRKVTEDKEGNLWLSTNYSGLVKIRFNNGSTQDYEVYRYGKEDGLPRIDNNKVFQLPDKLYVTTRKGIYSPTKERVTDSDSTISFVREQTFGKLFNKQELPILQILRNQQGERFVFAEGEGFGRILQQDATWRWEKTPFKKIPARAIYRFYIDQENIIWALGLENIYRYNPQIRKDYSLNFQTLIRRVSTGDSVLFNGNADSTMHRASELTHKQNSFTFTFAAPFFDREKEIEYQYKLEGFEEEWSEWTENQIKEYTNLPPGNYTFHVKGRNIFGKVSKPDTYQIVIYNAWYHTIYAYMGYALLAIILFYLAVVIYSRRLKQLNQRLEQMVNERTEKMRKQNEEIAKQNEEILKQNEEISKQKKEIQKQTKEHERKNAELQNLSIVAEETDNAIMITDSQGNFEWVNKGYTRIFGLTFEQLLQISKNIIGPNTPEHVKEKIQRAITEKETIYYEFSTRTPEGKDIYVQATLTPIVNQYGKVVKLVAVDADITRVKKAEEEVNRQKEEIEKQMTIYKKQKNQIEKAYKNIKLLSEFGQKITSTLDIDAINNLIYDYVNDLMDIDAFGIGEYNKKDGLIEFNGFMEKGMPVPYFKFGIGRDKSLVSWAFENKQDLLINDFENEYNEYVSQKPDYETRQQPGSIIIVPLLIESQAIGVVTAQSFQKNNFTFNDMSLIKSLASYIAIALENTRVYKLVTNQNKHINASIRYAKTLQKDRKSVV